MTNPLLNQAPLPVFSTLSPAKIEPTLKQIISENRNTLQTLLANDGPFTWENLILPLEEMDNRLGKMWSPVAHLHAVMESEALRVAYNACLPQLTEYHTECLQNKTLYEAVKSIAASPAYQQFSPAQKKSISNQLRDFRLAGVGLEIEARARFLELQKKLGQLCTQFGENVLDATHGWTFHTTDMEMLKGLPDKTIEMARQTAKEHGKEGFELTLDYPCYSSVMMYLEDRTLRRTFYEAFVTRASDQGPKAGRWDNTPIMDEILAIRHELALLLGFPNFAEYSLATKMAKSPKEVLDFLQDLVSRSKKFGEKDMQALSAFAKSTDQLESLEAFDVPYYSEKLRVEKYDVSQETLRAYFPVNKVLSGMFAVMERLLGIRMVERTDVDTWHPHVQFFEIHDKNNVLRGYFYTDLYARKHKRDGAWMDECRIRQRLQDGTLQYPVAFLTCNFTPPMDDKPAQLTHDDVQTLFHEFGHCLHHLLTKVDVASVSGINGVPWDAVEFPSQFFEHWCYDRETLRLISAHETTGEPLPDALYKKMIAAKNFQAGMQMLRQLEFSLFDFRIHLEFDPTQKSFIQNILDEVRREVAVVKTPAFNRFQHGFSHIFAGSYAAGYYSYKWAEVLSSDAFSLFEEKGIFDPASGQSYLENILEKGGVYDPMDLFVAFRGRKPSLDALLRESGFVE